eukprot:6987942-Prymnesium_polylepis.1
MLSPPPPLSRGALRPRARRDARARARAADRAHVRRLGHRVALRAPLAGRHALKPCPTDAFLRHIVPAAAPAARVDAVAVRHRCSSGVARAPRAAARGGGASSPALEVLLLLGE